MLTGCRVRLIDGRNLVMKLLPGSVAGCPGVGCSVEAKECMCYQYRLLVLRVGHGKECVQYDRHHSYCASHSHVLPHAQWDSFLGLNDCYALLTRSSRACSAEQG